MSPKVHKILSLSVVIQAQVEIKNTVAPFFRVDLKC